VELFNSQAIRQENFLRIGLVGNPAFMVRQESWDSRRAILTMKPIHRTEIFVRLKTD